MNELPRYPVQEKFDGLAMETATETATALLKEEVPHLQIESDSSRSGTYSSRGATTLPSPYSEQEYMMNRDDASGEIPPMRWEPHRNRDARNNKILDQTTSRGYFVDNLNDFDATLFGISPKEAEQMDPQQRVSLEVSWEALERAGISPQNVSGSDNSVFWGVNSDDFSKLVLVDLENVEAWMGIGTAYCGITNRISYQLNLMGPSTAVDAACASSSVAIHHGRQSVLLKESRVSIVGGVNALYGPGLTRVLDKAGAVSPEGRYTSFDDSAHGYGRGEGAGAIILKDLQHAIEDGDNILAILRGTAVAQDGRTHGIMGPNAKAQELVARNALREAAIDPSTIHYVEAHATSTPLGDPTEVSAISAIYGKSRLKADPCYIGFIKPNIGHLKAGAGAMGFIKAVLAMQHGIIPPQANLENLSSKINWDEAGVLALKEPAKWPKPEGTRRAAICSYEYRGTVAHAVIEERPRLPTRDFSQLQSATEDKGTVLLLSAPEEKRIPTQAQALYEWLRARGDRHDLDSVTSTLACRRAHHDYRAAVVVNSYDHALQSLQALGQSSNGSYITQSRDLGNGAGSV